MVDRAVSRLRDIKNSIDEMKALLSGRSLAELSTDTIRRAASNVSWRFSAKPRGMFRIRGRPNGPGYPGERSRRSGIEIRHEYRLIDLEILWSINEHDLDPLERAVNAMLATHDQ